MLPTLPVLDHPARVAEARTAAAEHIRDYMEAEHEKRLRAERKARRKANHVGDANKMVTAADAPGTPRT